MAKRYKSQLTLHMLRKRAYLLARKKRTRDELEFQKTFSPKMTRDEKEDFVQALKEYMHNQNDETISTLFQLFDKEAAGVVDKTNLIETFGLLQAESIINRSELENIMRATDKCDRADIDADEFSEILLTLNLPT